MSVIKLKGHPAVHWPTVTVGLPMTHRPATLDPLLTWLCEEFADTWASYCAENGVHSGDGLARVVILIDIAPEIFGERRSTCEGRE